MKVNELKISIIFKDLTEKEVKELKGLRDELVKDLPNVFKSEKERIISSTVEVLEVDREDGKS